MAKVVNMEEVVDMIENGSVIMIGGFLGKGTPEGIVDAIVRKGAKNLTVIGNDTGFPDVGIGKLVVNRQVAKCIVSHIGTNPETGKQMNGKELVVELVPQGTLAEQIRSAGAGLGGVLTPTGIGTIVAEGKQIIVIDGREFLVEKPLKAEIALIKAHKADTSGNLIFRRTTRNFNSLMATAANIVIAEVSEIVSAGDIDPDEVMVPGVFVDYMVQQ